MTTVDYYPKKNRLDFIAPDGMIGGGIMGDRAHIRAAEMIMNGSAIVRICGINSKMNKQYLRRLKSLNL
jgi:hypothetical protein